MEIPVFGKEQYPLNRESGLSYTISDIYKHVPIHTHTHYELFIISEGTAYHMINDSVQTVRKGDLFFIRPNDMHSYNFYHSEISASGIWAFLPRCSEMFPCFWSRRKRWIS